MSMAELVLLLVSAAVGCVITDLISGAFHLRHSFNRWLVTRWLLTGLHPSDRPSRPWNGIFQFPWNALLEFENSKDVVAWGRELQLPDNERSVERDLCRLAVGGRLKTLYRVAPDQLAAQVNAAAEATLDSPYEHGPLLAALSGIGVIDYESRRNPETQRYEPVRRPNADLLDDYVKIRSFREQLEQKERDSDRARLMDQRARLAEMIQRRIDDLQITARNGVQLRDQATYIVTALGVSFVLPVAIGVRQITLGLLAGFVAPLVHDLRVYLRQPH